MGVSKEAARRRFVREARAAASVRHPNVASVFHLGKSGDCYFYAMEFVDGEPLDRLIRRFGRLETKLALEIATQVAGGLAAIHEQNLVHQDIKPNNVMVKLKGDSLVAKIIDLGLAKGVAESQSETAISIPGSFAGTPAVCQPGTICRSQRRHSLGFLLTRHRTMEHVDGQDAIPGYSW